MRNTLPSDELRDLLTPDNCTLMLIDFQAQMLFGVQSEDRQTVINNAVGLAKTAHLFTIPTIVTTVTEQSFSGPMPKQLQAVFPTDWIDRTTMNPWEDARVVDAVVKAGRPKLILAGLWTEVCVAMPALAAKRAGYDVSVVVDACGGTSNAAHEAALQRMVHAGIVPMTWLQVLLELQRDWARNSTSMGVSAIAQEHAGAYGQGMAYVMSRYAMNGAAG
jgi:nicotinamidase-related amidase